MGSGSSGRYLVLEEPVRFFALEKGTNANESLRKLKGFDLRRLPPLLPSPTTLLCGFMSSFSPTRVQDGPLNNHAFDSPTKGRGGWDSDQWTTGGASGFGTSSPGSALCEFG